MITNEDEQWLWAKKLKHILYMSKNRPQDQQGLNPDLDQQQQQQLTLLLSFSATL